MSDTTNTRAYETPKLDATGLSQVWAEIVKLFATKKAAEDLKTKLDTVEENAQVNIIEGVQVNGVDLEVSEDGKKVNVIVPTGALAELDEVGTEQLSEALAAVIAGKADAATTLAGYGIADAYTKDEADAAIKSAVGTAVAGVYKVKGAVDFANLPTEGMTEGDVYNVKDAFTTTDDFIEGKGHKYPAGTNVCHTADGWDCMAGVFDFSDFMMKSDITNISEEEIKRICVLPTVE